MRIVVCVKQTPAATSEKRLTADMRLDRARVEGEINTYDRVAIEEALRTREKYPAGVVLALSMGPPTAARMLRTALAMGVDSAVLVTDAALAGADLWSTGLGLAGALARLSADLVFLGMQSDDAATGVLAGAIAERLGLALMTQTAHLMIEGTTVRTHRRQAGGYAVLEAQLPALVGVTETINTPRYPTLPGIFAARQKHVLTWSLADLRLDHREIHEHRARTRIVEAVSRPLRRRGDVLVADDQTARRVADFLAARHVLHMADATARQRDER